MPNDQSTETLGSVVEVFEVVATTAVISNFAVNLIFSSALNLLWVLINSLQIIAHYTLINVPMPANTELLFNIFIKIATFELPVESIMEAIDEVIGEQSDS